MTFIDDYLYNRDMDRGSWSDAIGACASSPAMVALDGVMSIAYIVFLGTEAELLSHAVIQDSNDFLIGHSSFDGYFFASLLFRSCALGFRNFFCGKDQRWAILESLLTGTAVVDVIFFLTTQSESYGTNRRFRILRILRLCRVLRIFQYVRRIREFQKMVYALVESMQTLAYLLVLLVFVIFFFSIGLVYGTMEIQADPAYEYNPVIDMYWGSFSKAMYSCFLATCGGQSWHVMIEPLWDYSPMTCICFILYISLTVFGVMNVITSVFVESAVTGAQHYKDLIIQEKERKKEIAFNHMREVFSRIDEDDSGGISEDELISFLRDDDLSNYLEALDINATDSRMLFRLLNTDDDGMITLQEFCDGLLRLKGGARSFDVHVIILQLKRFFDKWSQFANFVQDRIAKLEGENVKSSSSKVSKAFSSRKTLSQDSLVRPRGSRVGGGLANPGAAARPSSPGRSEGAAARGTFKLSSPEKGRVSSVAGI
eukprot:TRINITY_DN9049_c0_g1_i1.p1 TRINITY_DN9049_c0_g1~~TRINITY_DN9049_c0_g1_i1.p1  ORF type:complete len:484 (+),score=60.07 TRINITY_DN9049_c0_g1_i1:1102-2553(+)